MVLLQQGILSTASGLLGDWRGKPGPRQITLMTLSDWRAACEELGIELPWHSRRANLLVDELPLYQQTGARIQLGDAVLEITGETDPCERMEAIQPGLFQALKPRWRGGVTCRVITGGTIQVGMTVRINSDVTYKESITTY
jgi:MOSC domain-containing protein YiiM